MLPYCNNESFITVHAGPYNLTGISGESNYIDYRISGKGSGNNL